jgi:cystathionine beta-synthase
MSKKYLDNILETIGNTPLIKLNRMTKGIKATILAKVEFFNPGGSVKDRIAITMINAAEKEGLLKPGGTIVEATSGNTGAGLALIASVRGYKAIFTMPDKMSMEKVRHLKGHGADVIVTPTAVSPESPESYYSVAKKIVSETPNSILANQYFNVMNPEAHYLTTGPEIWNQTDGKIDYFVAGIGTGGTITGVGKFLKEQNPDIKIIAVDPVGSILKEYFYTKRMIEAKPYKVEGVGEDIIPGTLNFQYVDEVIPVTDKESFNAARRLTREEGIFVGGSCGMAVHAALKRAKNLPENKMVVVLLPDSGYKYLSTFYSDDWMQENRFLDFEKISIRTVLEAKSNAIPSLISASLDEPIRSALDKMKKFNIAQLPIFENGKPVGSIDESTVLGRILEDNSLIDGQVKEVIQESFPMVESQSSIEAIKHTLSKRYSAVLVEDSGEILGIITKMDLLEFIGS